MAKRILKKPKKVEIVFYDHYTQDGPCAENCKLTVRGWLWARDEKYYYVATNLVDGSPVHSNASNWGILKSALIKPRRL